MKLDGHAKVNRSRPLCTLAKIRFGLESDSLEIPASSPWREINTAVLIIKMKLLFLEDLDPEQPINLQIQAK